jgi:hypothetical protein
VSRGAQERRGPPDRSRGHRALSSRSTDLAQRRYSVTAGRLAVGTIEVDGIFVAIDANGNIIGRFEKLLIAARALPDGRAS